MLHLVGKGSKPANMPAHRVRPPRARRMPRRRHQKTPDSAAAVGTADRPTRLLPHREIHRQSILTFPQDLSRKAPYRGRVRDRGYAVPPHGRALAAEDAGQRAALVRADRGIQRLDLRGSLQAPARTSACRASSVSQAARASSTACQLLSRASGWARSKASTRSWATSCAVGSRDFTTSYCIADLRPR